LCVLCLVDYASVFFLVVGIHNYSISYTVRVLVTLGDIAKSRMLLLLWLSEGDGHHKNDRVRVY